MPNFDGGRYFLTVLAPIRTDPIPVANGGELSCEQVLRTELASLPTALQSPLSIQTGINSPFARNNRTHFARFSVLSDLPYNGREPTDAILGSIKGVNPIIPQKIDHLSCPFLLFALDFDVRDGTDCERDQYLCELWKTMESELSAVFQYCVGFAGVASAQDFARYMASCQIETTMSFNDYWAEPPPLQDLNFRRPLFVAKACGVICLAALLVWLVGLVGGPRVTSAIEAVLPASVSWRWLAGLAALGFTGVILVVWSMYRRVMRTGAKPFPKAPNSDLRSILKAIYLQQRFTEFVIANQGSSDEALYRQFQAFLKQHRPSDLSGPTQDRGVIATPLGGGE